MSQAFYPTNDGHIGNLAKLTEQELKDLIARQTSLLGKRNFTQKLPDKGEKIKELLEKLTQELEKRRSQSSSEDTNRNLPTVANNSQISNDDIENTFERLQIDNANVSDAEKPKHMFEIAEERARQNINDMRIVTRLNQNIKASHVEDLPEYIKAMQPSSGVIHKKPVVPEESAAVPPNYKFNEARIIPLEESLHLQREQKEKLDKIQTVAAAQRLSQRLGVKMESYNPEGVDMSYRGVSQDIDSDDEPEMIVKERLVDEQEDSD